MRMELIENLLQLLVTFVGALLSGISYRKSGRQVYFLLLCFYGCFALGALYWTLYLLLFDTTPRVFYVSEFGWVASVIFLRILQATLTETNERSFRCRRAWLAPAFGAMLLREDAGGYVLVGVVCFAAAVVITALCFRLRNRENQKDKPTRHEQEEESQ